MQSLSAQLYFCQSSIQALRVGQEVDWMAVWTGVVDVSSTVWAALRLSSIKSQPHVDMLTHLLTAFMFYYFFVFVERK